MSYDEKLLREFVKHSLDSVRIDEVLTSDASAKGGRGEGSAAGSPAPLSYSERWGYGRHTAVQAKGIWGKVFGLPQSFFDLKDALFGNYTGGWCEEGRTCPGLFPAIVDVATQWGKKLIDILFNTANPPPTNAGAEAMGAGLFPKLKSYYTNPTAARSPTTLNLTESMTWNDVSIILEQSEGADLISAVIGDLQGIEDLVKMISNASDLVDLMKMWQNLTGDTGGTQELSAVMSDANDGAGISDADFGAGGIPGVISEFINSIARPMISGVEADTRDELINIGLPPDVESAIKGAFDSTIRKIS